MMVGETEKETRNRRLLNVTKVLFGLLILFFLFWFFYFIFTGKLIVEMGLSVMALIITLIIAITQQIQLDKIETIGADTQKTAISIDKENKSREAVDKFFRLKQTGNEKFELFFPVEYKDKPLPLINQGDFYAIHVISSRLGEEKITNKPLRLSPEPVDPSKSNNVIYICSPDANPALEKIYEVMQVVTIADKKYFKGRNFGIVPRDYQNASGEYLIPCEKYDVIPDVLPCWFARTEAGNKNHEKTSDKITNPDSPKLHRIIYLPEHQLSMESAADTIYKKAAKGEKILTEEQNNQRDYGIFGRWQCGEKQIFVLAGIHQYGTWIIATLLSELLSGEDVEGRDIFLGTEDFIAIIEGKFQYPELRVEPSKIRVEKIWTKKDGVWHECKVAPKKQS